MTEEEHFRKNCDFMQSLSVEERLKFGKRELVLPGFRTKNRAFDTMQDYRKWLNTLPAWMGFSSGEVKNGS